ncbi:long-chain-fatty-acid--CoA ligase [Halostagnicola sp. A-GB9-2]|uniref:long-chain-fatty-acid--CoA ligase n=1 Tax=Halostagnicola sp. A-GB9-2 TaxID=3048066 RepID=UPI0024C0B0B8|nr:long-chain-fatty-acid--CoA ligase [Halostagnicola sp. A-GB9-2]MDJ1432847.1 long-chain-fatty-acid--CoA ligase [Halostagnicola sp. A-GB9-2]
MKDYELTLQVMLDRAVSQFGHKEIVSEEADGTTHRYTYSEAEERICQLANGLDELGLELGSRASVMAINHHRHYELYFGLSCSGRSIHMTNHMLPEEHIVEIINEAEDEVVFVDPEFVDTVEAVANKLETVEEYVILDDEVPETDLEPVRSYEDLLEGQDAAYEWPEIDEEREAGICYTSGTTGLPKGAAYTHRGLYLHTLTHSHVDVFKISENDVVMPVVPMYHVNGWGLPYTATFCGSKLVLPGPKTSSEETAALIDRESVTVTAAVPTVWREMASFYDERDDVELESLDRVLTGGSSPPEWLMEKFDKEIEAPIHQGYGMTEAAPHLVNTMTTTEVREELDESGQYHQQMKPGIPAPGVQIRLRDQNGDPVPHDGESSGEIQARSPWLIDEYFNRPEQTEQSFTDDVPESEATGESDGVSSRRWFKSGDVGTIDEYGYLEVVDRLDDIIKSGGEWISSIELENELMAHDAVEEATVISVEHEKWDERPVAYVVSNTEDVTAGELEEHLLERYPKWWMPDKIVFREQIPKTTTGKFNKKVLRDDFDEEYDGLPLEE